MSNLTVKLQAFEFVLFNLIDWYKEKNSIQSNEDFNSTNDLNKLKVIKLHFFVSAVNAKNNKLLSIFDKFYAMPYGHVESDIYNNLNQMKYYKVDIKRLSIIDSQPSFDNLNFEIKKEITNAIIELRRVNDDLINYNALQLVELSHKWFSWSSMFSYAKSNLRNSEFIPTRLIQEENKSFELVY